MKSIIPLYTAVLLSLPMSSSFAADLSLSISGANPAEGHFLVSVFSSRSAWMKQPANQKAINVAANGTASIKFNLPSGTYGIAVVHDANSDGQINVNGLGIPTEAFGFSNNATAMLGPPKFKHASFVLSEGGSAITIRLGRAE